MQGVSEREGERGEEELAGKPMHLRETMAEDRKCITRRIMETLRDKLVISPGRERVSENMPALLAQLRKIKTVPPSPSLAFFAS